MIADIISCNKMYTEQRSAGSIEELRKYIGDKYATKRRFGEIDSHPIYCKGRYLYDVHKIVRLSLSHIS